mmetsp:Transcript_11822/g.19332  ORF Transcript_11822/g.19332 Transcript_11822/m.19332 type:complete len:342 (+) Transcript_11822:92-1117(+)
MTTLFSIFSFIASLVLSSLHLSANAFSVPAPHGLSARGLSMQKSGGHDYVVQNVVAEECYNADDKSRRTILINAAAAVLATSSSSPSLAEEIAKDSNKSGVVSTGKLASLLKSIPTFALVDARGVPYFVVGEDAKLTSYFFLSYTEAKRILDVAISSSDQAIKETKKEIKAKKGVVTKEDEAEIGINPWKQARITSVPLDLAVSLCSKGKLAGAYFRLAPSEADIEDALQIDGSDDLPEGKVPLFYVEDFSIADKEPLYFTKEQLIADWKSEQKSGDKTAEPVVKVSELFATITEMVRPDGKDEELKSIVFVAPLESEKRSKQCLKGEKEPFRLGERNIVL